MLSSKYFSLSPGGAILSPPSVIDKLRGDSATFYPLKLSNDHKKQTDGKECGGILKGQTSSYKAQAI